MGKSFISTFLLRGWNQRNGQRFLRLKGESSQPLARIRAKLALAGVVVLLMAFSSCSKDKNPEHDYPALTLPAGNWQDSIAGPAQTQKEGRLRAVATLHDQLIHSRSTSADLLQDTQWSSNQRRTQVENNDDGLTVRFNSAQAKINAQPQVPAWRYNTLAARISSEHIGALRVRWKSNWLPSVYSDELELPIMNENEESTYLFTLYAGDRGTWRGIVDDLEIEIDTPAGEAVVTNIELGFDGSRPREGILINDTYMEAIYSPHFEWRVTVPENGRLEFHVASLQPIVSDAEHVIRVCLFQESELSGGATAPLGQSHIFPIMDRTLNLADPENGGTLLLEQSIPTTTDEADRKWESVHVDISEYAGKAVVLRFESGKVDNGQPVGVAWGNPMIAAPTPEIARTPIILISNDSLRAENVSAYGYHRNTTPNIDAFLEDAVLYEQAIVPEPWTLSTHMSMFTGLYPHHHGVNATSNLSAVIPTLPERLSQEADYRTEGVTGHRWWLEPSRGFGRGFDRYTPFTYVDGHFIPIGDMQPMVIDWLDDHATDNLFLFYHNYDIHSKFEDTYPAPYWPVEDRFLHFSKELGPIPDFRSVAALGEKIEQLLLEHNMGRHTISDEMREYMIALYDDCIRMVDHYLGELFEHLKKLDIYEDALIIVTADHGESFDEHGQYSHISLHETNLHVPLLVKYPKNWRAGARVSEQVSLTSLYPTILEAAGITPPGDIDAPSLQAFLREETPSKNRVFAWNDVNNSDFMARDYPWKLIYDKKKENFQFFNLHNDPGESTDLWQEGSDMASSLSDGIQDFYFADMNGLFVRIDTPKRRYARVRLNLDAESWDARLSATTTYTEPALHEPGGGLIEAHLPLRKDTSAQVYVSRIEGESPTALLDLYMDGPWQILVGEDYARVETRHLAEFALEDLPDSPSQTLPKAVDPELPLVQVWHGSITGPQTEAADLSDEAQDELEALGYF